MGYSRAPTWLAWVVLVVTVAAVSVGLGAIGPDCVLVGVLAGPVAVAVLVVTWWRSQPRSQATSTASTSGRCVALSVSSSMRSWK